MNTGRDMSSNSEKISFPTISTIEFPGVNRVAVGVIDNALPNWQLDSFIQHTRQNKQKFAASKTNGAITNSRRSSTLSGTRKLTRLFRNAVLDKFESICGTLLVEPFQISTIETQFTFHGNGDYFHSHTDNSSLTTCSRKISIVLYMQPSPRSFSGGELKLYPTLNKVDDSAGTVTIKPLHNRLVFFNSSTLHEVLPIFSNDKEALNCRGSLTAWIRTAEVARCSKSPAQNSLRLTDSNNVLDSLT